MEIRDLQIWTNLGVNPFAFSWDLCQTLINSHQTKVRETQTNHFALLRTMVAAEDSDGDSIVSITDSEEEAVQVFFGFGVPHGSEVGRNPNPTFFVTKNKHELENNVSEVLGR